MPPLRITVLVIDGSASVRQTLTEVLSSDPAITVIGATGDSAAASRRMQKQMADVIILDIDAPHLDGLGMLQKIMAQRPVPVIACTAGREPSPTVVAEALKAGAVDVIAKSPIDTRERLLDARAHICETVKAAACRQPRQLAAPSSRFSAASLRKLSADVIIPPPSRCRVAAGATERVICIGASTGGTESLRVVLEALPADSPAIVIVQHMPEKFTAAFAQRLDGLTAIEVKEAEDGDTVCRGRALIAPGNRHLLLQRCGVAYRAVLHDGPPVSRHRPSVDVLFRSAAHHAGPNALGILMTGMGDDGARGLLEMRQSGAETVAQDERSSVVFGMPREAIQLGAAAKVLPLDRLAAEIIRAGAY